MSLVAEPLTPDYYIANNVLGEKYGVKMMIDKRY
jgi:hypothetical protein